MFINLVFKILFAKNKKMTANKNIELYRAEGMKEKMTLDDSFATILSRL